MLDLICDLIVCIIKQASLWLNPRYWPTACALMALRIVAYFPYCCQLLIGRYLGWLAYYLIPRRRHITQVNLRLCFPDLSQEARERLCRRSFESVGIGVIEMAIAWWAPQRRLANIAHIEGIEHLQDALKKGKGVILLGAHFTTLDLAGRIMSMHFPVSVMYRRSKNPLIDAVMSRRRGKSFQQVINREDIRGVLRALKNNEALWYAPDQDYGRKHSVFAPFFATSAATITMTARLAQRSGAVVLPAFQYRLPNAQGYSLHCFPALKNFPSGDAVQDATRINQIIEQAIRKAPEQYLWQHRRFKTRPEGEARPY